MKYVSKMLSRNNHLKSLYLSVNNIGDDGVAEVMPGLMNNTAIWELSVASCGIGDKGMELLFTALKANGTIKSLDLGYAPSTKALGAKANELSPASAKLLVEYIMAQTRLENLNLGKMSLIEDHSNILRSVIEDKNAGRLEIEWVSIKKQVCRAS